MSQLSPFGGRPASQGNRSIDWASDLAVVGLAAALSLLWCVGCDYFVLNSWYVLFGGVGFAASILAFFAVAVRLRGRAVELDRSTRVVLAAVVALACVPAITTSTAIRVANAFVLALACMVAFLRLSGCDARVATTASGIAQSVAFFVRSLFSHLGGALRALGHLRPRSSSGEKGLSSQALTVALSLLAGLVVLALVVPFLVEGDAVFAQWVACWADGLGSLWGLLDASAPNSLARVGRWVAITLVVASLLLSVTHGDGARVGERAPRERRAPVAAVLPGLVLVDAVYLVFVAAQFATLFGVPAARVASAYSETARTGFFQLTWAAAISVSVVAATLWLRRDADRASSVTAAQVAMLAATGVMDVSAAWRMGLYVAEYGLTVLRALTFLGMVAIAVLVVLAAFKSFSPRLPVVRVAAFALATLWCAFALSGVDGWVAALDVDWYLAGSVPTVDTDYLGGLSAEAAPALRRLAAEATDPEVRERAAMALESCDRPAAVWSDAAVWQLFSSSVRG